MFEQMLDASELGFVALDHLGRLLYMNPSARRLLGAGDRLPQRVLAQLSPMIDHVRETGAPRVARWSCDEMTLRARLRPLAARGAALLLELSVVHADPGGDVLEVLARNFEMRRADARLLLYLWRGLRNEEIAVLLGVPIGTVKSRLHRLYRRHGLRNRSSAVLAVASIIQDSPVPRAANG